MSIKFHSSVWLFLLFSLTLIGCSPFTKEQFITQQKDFIEEVRKEHHTYDEKDWDQKNKELNQALQEEYPKFEDEMSLTEKVNVWGQVLSYHLMQSADRAAENWDAHEEEYLQLMEENAELIEETGKVFKDEILPELKKVLPKLEEIGKDFIQKLEDQGTLDRLEESLEQWADSIEIEVHKDSESVRY